ncbi:hypothetical protein AHF37_04655 [Paragonimus kellicotti]|nr:hypothetical protein AHF37_04655 [Paragonimus kellicotti]
MAVHIERHIVEMSAKKQRAQQDVTFYHSGHTYCGQLKDGQRTGYGELYRGQFRVFCGYTEKSEKQNAGCQQWMNGDRYAGDFVNDRRNGWGFYTAYSGETFEGTFFEDRRHGYGVNKWPDGSSYFGTFFLDKRSGYGVMTYADGAVFEGFFDDDNPEGPGIFMSSSDHNQVIDVGYWCSGRLVRLLYPVNNNRKFSWTTEFPEYSFYSSVKGEFGKQPLNCATPIYNTHKHRIDSVFKTSPTDQRVEHRKPTCIIQDIKQDRDSLRDWLFKDLPAQLHVWDARSTLFDHFLADLFFRRLLHCKPPITDSEWPTYLTDAILNIIPQIRQCLRDRSDVMINPEAPTTGVLVEACTVQSAETNLETESTTNWATCDGFLAPVTNKKSLKSNKQEKDPQIEFERMHAIDINVMRYHQVRQLRLIQKFVRQAFANWNQRRGHSAGSADPLIPQTVVPSLDWTGLWKSRLKTTRRGAKRASFSVGLHEQRAKAFLTNCQVGSVENIKTLLFSDPAVGVKHVTLDPNVADQYGCFGLLWAVLAWNEQLVNLLMDFGANVNQVTDEGLCALSACLLYYYRAIEQLSGGLEGKDGAAKPHIRIYRPRCQSEDSSSTLSARSDGQCERTFVFRAEITMFLSDKSPESEKEQQHKAKIAQMQRLYTSRPQIAESLRTKSNVASAKEQNGNSEVSLEHLPVKPKLPSFQRFTDCLTRLTKQFQDSLTHADPSTQKTREFSLPERMSSPSLTDRRSSSLPNCHEELPANLEETQFAKVEKLTSEENAVPFSRRSLYDHPIQPITAPYLDVSASELAENTYFLAKRSISPATLSRTGRDSGDRISDSLEMNVESNSAVQRRAVLIAQKNQIVRMIDLLLRRGADPNAANQPLPCIFMAVQMEDVAMVERLLKHGADPNACLRIKSQSEQKHNLYSKVGSR